MAGIYAFHDGSNKTASVISVLILTKNEESDILSCLESVSWSDDIQVFDSFSEDRTVEIAIRQGAKVTQRKFDGYASQRNAALTDLNYKYQWILLLDADERIPGELADSMRKRIRQADNSVNGFRIRRRDYMDKTWLKHAQMTPFYIRLVRKGKGYYEREVNEVLHVDGKVEDIDGYFDHYPFSKGISHWLSRHNQYSSLEAAQCLNQYKGRRKFSFRKALFGSDFSEKRFHQKGLFYQVPARPLIKWFYLVFWRGGFLDGKAGIKYATLTAIYEYFIVLKTKELLAAQPGPNGHPRKSAAGAFQEWSLAGEETASVGKKDIHRSSGTEPW